MKFLLGLVVGVGAGLLLAPDRGEVTRRRLARTARELAEAPEEKLDQTVQQVSEAAREKAGDIGSRVGRQAAEAITASVLGNPEERTA